MMRKVCGVLSAIIVILMCLLIICGSPLAIYQIERAAEAYILGEGCNETDIISIKGYFDRRLEEKHYYAEVYLRQSPEKAVYFYYDQSGKLTQLQGEFAEKE